MKKVLSLLTVFVLIISMTACGKSDPKASVSGFLGALKNSNIEEMSKYIVPDSEENGIEEVFDSGDEFSEEAFKIAFSKLDYKILSSSVDGNTAVVETEINAPNLGKIMTELIQEALPLVFASAFSEDASDDDVSDFMNTLFLDKVNSDDMPMVKKTVKINLVEENGNWLINPDNDFVNAITGNLMQMGEMFN